MNKKLLSIATAAVLTAPLAVQAEVTLSGEIQAEVGSVEAGSGGDRTTVTSDGTGTVSPGGGPNRIKFSITEDLGGGLEGFANLDWAFNTTQSSNGSNLTDREKYVGLRAGKGGPYLRIGRIQGVYKTIFTGVDPFYATAGQGRTWGGMSGGGTDGEFTHSGFIDNVVELGFGGKKGFNVALQGVVGEDNRGAAQGSQNGSALAGVKYSTDNFTVFGAFSNRTIDESGSNAEDLSNWKVGGQFKMGGLNLGVQYENAEMGTSHLGSTKGEFVMGSLTYGMGKVTLAGWVSQYMADESSRDALSYSVGAIYGFSNRTMAYAAYHEVDSDADAVDANAFGVGVRHSF